MHLFISKNNAVINKNLWKTQGPILLFKIPVGKRRNFFEIIDS